MNAKTLRDQILGHEINKLVLPEDMVPHKALDNRDLDAFIQSRLQSRGDAIEILYDIVCGHTRGWNTESGRRVDTMVELLRGYLDYAMWIRSENALVVPPDREELCNEVVIGEICALCIAATTLSEGKLIALVANRSAIVNPAYLEAYARVVSSHESPFLLLIPFVHGDHWTLLSYRRETNEFRHYDSLRPGLSNHLGYCTRIANIMSSFFPDELQQTARIVSCSPPPDQRQRGIDCGYYAIAFAVEELIDGGKNLQSMRDVRYERQAAMRVRWADYRRLGPDAVLLRDLVSSSFISVVDKILV
jgi:hypothetical protein